MAIKDLRSNIEVKVALAAAITGNGETEGASIDTANAGNGIAFVVSCPVFTDGTYSFVLEESATGAFAGEENVIDSDKLIGSLSGLNINAAKVAGTYLGTVGVFSNKRYVRVVATAADVTNGATLNVNAILAPNVTPSANLSA